MGPDGGARNRRWRSTTAVRAWIACAAWATTAGAAPFDLAWSAPEGCPSREEMVAATRTRLGEDETEASPDLFVRGTVSADGEAFVVTFLVKDATGAEVGERELRVKGHECRAIEEPAALVLATMISVVRPSSFEPAPVGPPEPSAAVEATSTALPTPPPSPLRPPPGPAPAALAADAEPTLPSLHALGAVGVASIGILPQAGGGVGLRTSYWLRSRFLVALEMSFEAGASVRAGRGVVAFQLLSTTAMAGVTMLRAAKVELVPVLALRGGILRTAPSGFQLVKAAARPMALAGGGVLVRAPLAPRVHFEILPQAEVALVRDVFEATEGRRTFRLHQSSLLGARLTVGISYEFP